jgi:hypothetical protein
MEWIAIGAALLTGFGTTTLAFFTWRLAGSTRADVEAQWRPLLVPSFHNAIPGIPTSEWSGWATVTDENAFRFSFQNVGKGAALKLTASVADPPSSTTHFISCGPLRSPVLAVEKTAVFEREHATIADNRIRVRVDYADLAGNPQHTVAVYLRVPDAHPDWVVESVEPSLSKPKSK